MATIALPSGAIAPVERPGLLPLLSAGGGSLALARATLAHEELDAASLSLEDRYAVALWGLRELAASEEGALLAAVGEAYGCAPSRRLGVTDPVLAWTLDRDCLASLRAAREQAAHDREAPAEHDERRAFTYSVPDTWSSDD